VDADGSKRTVNQTLFAADTLGGIDLGDPHPGIERARSRGTHGSAGRIRAEVTAGNEAFTIALVTNDIDA
jgi:hypothetical protein